MEVLYPATFAQSVCKAIETGTNLTPTMFSIGKDSTIDIYLEYEGCYHITIKNRDGEMKTMIDDPTAFEMINAALVAKRIKTEKAVFDHFIRTMTF